MAGGKEVPTVQMVGKGGLIRVNASDREVYEKKGYKVAEEGDTPPAADSPPAASGKPVEDMSGKELDAFAEANEIALPAKATVADKRVTILDALDESEGGDEGGDEGDGDEGGE